MAELTAAADEALRIENLFLSGVQANIEELKGSHLRGSVWETAVDDDSDALRAMMASRRMYDREMLKKLPHNRRVVLKGYERRLFFWRRQTGTAVVSVLTPLEDLLDKEDRPRPVGLNELNEHMRKIAPHPKVRHIIGLCSTSGFTDEARSARHEYPNALLVLVEPEDGGGWRITTDEDAPELVRKMFDPEDIEQKMNRVSEEIASRGADLLTGGLSAEHIAERLNLSPEIVGAAMAREAASDPELRVSSQSGDRLLYRGAASSAKEKSSMSFVNRIKELFSSEGDETGKINLLAERRAALAQRRDRLYGEIGKLEEREADLVTQGRENKSTVVRRRLAAQVAQLRKDIARQNTTAKMLNQQINIISTDIHNLTLIQQGEMASLPDAGELTENAVRAEEMLETLKADADLVGSLETGIGEVLTSSEEMDILAEFDQQEAQSEESVARAKKAQAKKSQAKKSAQPTTPEDKVIAEFDDDRTEEKNRPESADPEVS